MILLFFIRFTSTTTTTNDEAFYRLFFSVFSFQHSFFVFLALFFSNRIMGLQKTKKAPSLKATTYYVLVVKSLCTTKKKWTCNKTILLRTTRLSSILFSFFSSMLDLIIVWDLPYSFDDNYFGFFGGYFYEILKKKTRLIN